MTLDESRKIIERYGFSGYEAWQEFTLAYSSGEPFGLPQQELVYIILLGYKYDGCRVACSGTEPTYYCKPGWTEWEG